MFKDEALLHNSDFNFCHTPKNWTPSNLNFNEFVIDHSNFLWIAGFDYFDFLLITFLYIFSKKLEVTKITCKKNMVLKLQIFLKFSVKEE